MYLELYQMNDTINTINKSKKLVKGMNITFKKTTNILTPYIKLYDPEHLEMYNYAYIDELARYYYITNTEPTPNGMIYIQLEVDVLESYKTEILESRKVNFIQKVDPVISILESQNGVEPDTSYILTTVAKTGDIDVDIDVGLGQDN